MPDETRRDAPPPTTHRLPRVLEAAFKNLPPNRAANYLDERTIDLVFEEARSRLLEQLEASQRRERLRLEQTLSSWETASRRSLEKAASRRGDTSQ